MYSNFSYFCHNIDDSPVPECEPYACSQFEQALNFSGLTWHKTHRGDNDAYPPYPFASDNTYTNNKWVHLRQWNGSPFPQPTSAWTTGGSEIIRMEEPFTNASTTLAPCIDGTLEAMQCDDHGSFGCIWTKHDADNNRRYAQGNATFLAIFHPKTASFWGTGNPGFVRNVDAYSFKTGSWNTPVGYYNTQTPYMITYVATKAGATSDFVAFMGRASDALYGTTTETWTDAIKNDDWNFVLVQRNEIRVEGADNVGAVDQNGNTTRRGEFENTLIINVNGDRRVVNHTEAFGYRAPGSTQGELGYIDPIRSTGVGFNAFQNAAFQCAYWASDHQEDTNSLGFDYPTEQDDDLYLAFTQTFSDYEVPVYCGV